MSLEASGPNTEMITYWNEQTGPRWVAAEAFLDAQIGPLGLLAIEASGVGAGARVVDVGCGCGQSSLELAERVGHSGSVLGIDLSTAMLERARERARAAGLSQLRFENADAQTHDFEPGSADLLFSRFGVMFFADPVTAFANLRRALVPGGRLAFVCWQALDRNPWMLVPLGAMAKHVALPPPPAPGSPGPFAFADPERVRGILADAGFDEVLLTPEERDLTVGGRVSLEEAVEFIMHIGPVSAALRAAGEDAEALRPAVRNSIRAALGPYSGSQGVRMGSASWIVTALAG